MQSGQDRRKYSNSIIDLFHLVLKMILDFDIPLPCTWDLSLDFIECAFIDDVPSVGWKPSLLSFNLTLVEHSQTKQKYMMFSLKSIDF